MTKLLKCPFCGGPLAIFTATEGLHAEGGCEACGWSMEEWSGNADKLAQRMNLRPAGGEGNLLEFQSAILRETTAHRHRMDEELVPLREVARVADLVWRGASLCETDEERYYRISPKDMEWLAAALTKVNLTHEVKL